MQLKNSARSNASFEAGPTKCRAEVRVPTAVQSRNSAPYPG
jgi:hypothetical protein